jgi:type I restriction enzyme S subunit
MFKAESYVGHKLCSPGDLVINTMWAWMGALGISKDTGIISPAYAVYRQRGEQRLSQGFIDALLRTRLYIDEFTRRSTGIRSSRLRMYPEEFFKVEILMPPRSEQEEIVSFISTHTANLNVAIERVSGEVDLLREYRTRLIADVVTGKLDVREAAAKLPDAAVEPETALEQEPEELELEEELVEGE